MNYNQKMTGISCCVIFACTLCGCGSITGLNCVSSSDDTQSTSDSAANVTYLDTESMFTDRDREVGYDAATSVSITLIDNASSCDSSGVTISDNSITITEEGTYVLSGSLSDGQIIVDTASDKKVRLVLDSVSINCNTSSALYVRQADKVFVTLAENSENTLSNREDFVAIDDNNIDSVIFAKSDLTLNGSGTLTINAAYGHGIVSKDDLVITSGTYNITAAKHALSGKDSVRIADGTLILTAGTDGIHSENTDEEDKGFIYIANGEFNITSDSDGLDSEYTLQIDDGTITIAAGDDGIHSDADLIITDGTINVTKCSEGLEGMTVTIESGEINIVSSDDGINAAGDGTSNKESSDDATGNNPPDGSGPDLSGDDADRMTPPDKSKNDDSDDFQDTFGKDGFEGGRKGMGGKDAGNDMGMGGGMDEATDYNLIQISGGSIFIDAEGDGIDSNGNLIITGGEIYICGPTTGGDGALDYAGDAIISGGVVVALGTSGMAQNFSSSSTQGAMLVTVGDPTLTGELVLSDSDGNTLVSFSPTKAYNSVLVSCSSLIEGETYTLITGDVTTEVEMTSLIYSSDNMGREGMTGGKNRTL